MQVLVDDVELREMQRLAKSKGLTLAEWVRQTLRAEYSRAPAGDTKRKLACVRSAARHQFPAPDIEQMIEEIGRGYSSGHDA